MRLKAFNDLVKMAEKLDEPWIIAIDGRCGSGKSTLGNKLAEMTGADVLHMDDFYLRKEQRTPERYSTPGENVDHERVEEFLRQWREGNPFTWQKFDHRTLEPGQTFLKYPIKKLVVEGSYCMHPDLRKYYTLTVFVQAEQETRFARLRKREKENFVNFEQKWIPLEEKYFQEMHIEEICDVIVSNENDDILQ